MYDPTPTILFGQLALCQPVTDEQGRSVFSATRATLIGSATLQWGRTQQWEQPEPSTLTFEFFDPSTYWDDASWAKRITGQTAVGMGVVMTVDLPAGARVAECPNGTFTVFQGLTTKVSATRVEVLTTEGYRNGWRVSVVAGDRTSSLGNIGFTWEDWGEERMIDRAIRLRDRAAPTGIRQFYYDAEHKDGGVAPVEVRDKTGLDIAHDLYSSFGTQWTYHHNRNVVIRIPEHMVGDEPRLSAQPDGTVCITMPPVVDPTGAEDAIDRAPHPGTGVSACDVTADMTLSTDQVSNITRVECKWKNKFDQFPFRTIITWNNKALSNPPFRLLSYESWFYDGRDIDPIHQRVQAKAFFQQAGPHHPAITYRTRDTGGFRNISHALWFLTASERHSYAFLSGSPWSSDLLIAPVVTPCGGAITFRDGHWEITTNLLRCHSTVVAYALRWRDSNPGAGIPASITWAGNPQRFDSSVSWADLWWVHSPNIVSMGDLE